MVKNVLAAGVPRDPLAGLRGRGKEMEGKIRGKGGKMGEDDSDEGWEDIGEGMKGGKGKGTGGKRGGKGDGWYP